MVLAQGPELAVVGLYLIVLLVLGWFGYHRREKNSLRDFYLAGGSLGFVVLLATLYATQYSGNTFLSFPGEAYLIGFAWISSVAMMMSVAIVYLLFAPALHVLAHRFGYITPADWVRHRFGDRRLAFLVSLIMAAATLNFLYAQFIAMGHVAVGMSDGRIPFWAGVVGLAVVIGLYETLGGLRSVAWSDVVQGLMLFVGLFIVLVVAWPEVGDLSAISHQLMQTRPELVAVPSWTQCAKWLSSIALLGFGAAVYPQAIQRIYAARDRVSLRRSLRVMVFMPLLTTFVVFVLGVAAHGLLPERSGLATDQIMPAMLAALFETGTLAQWAAVMVLAGGLGAIMSTADSTLLSVSSILTRDIVGEWPGKTFTDAELARLGKWLSWAIIVAFVVLAIRPPTTLWRLIEIKMELLMQVTPIFIFGIRSQYLDAGTAWRALCVGVGLAVGALSLGVDEIGGVHAGTYACVVNAAICVIGVRRNKQSVSQEAPF